MKRHLTYANVVATLALLLALGGGTAYAATKLKANSVGSTQLKSNSVTSGKVKNGALLAQDFKAGQLPPGATGANGASGPGGPAGSAGPGGAKGDAGAKGDTGAKGDAGTTGADGSVVARGLIRVIGPSSFQLFAASSNVLVENITIPSPGVVCLGIDGLTGSHPIALATVENGSTLEPKGNASVQVYDSLGTPVGCPASTSTRTYFQFRTFRTSGTVSGGTVAAPVPSDGVGFNFGVL